MVNISSQLRCWITPIRQMTPMTPNEMIERRFASSSIDTCSGVFFSSTWRQRCQNICQEIAGAALNQTNLLHHAEHDAKLALHARPDHDPLATPAPDQRAHERNVRPFADRDPAQPDARVRDGVGAFPCRAGLARQGRLVDLEAVGLRQADVGGDAVAGVEGDEVAGHEDVGEDGRLLAVPEQAQCGVRRAGAR